MHFVARVRFGMYLPTASSREASVFLQQQHGCGCELLADGADAVSHLRPRGSFWFEACVPISLQVKRWRRLSRWPPMRSAHQSQCKNVVRGAINLANQIPQADWPEPGKNENSLEARAARVNANPAHDKTRRRSMQTPHCENGGTIAHPQIPPSVTLGVRKGLILLITASSTMRLPSYLQNSTHQSPRCFV